MLGIVGIKKGITQIFDKDGSVVPVTVISAPPGKIVQIKTKEKDGYNSLQVGFIKVSEKKLNKPLKGHFARAGVENYRILREFRTDTLDQYKVGQEIRVDMFAPEELVDVNGTSKGKGFQGVIKRWGCHGGRKTHGSMSHRIPGSIGAGTFPGKVWKGHKMPGQMGNRKVTVKNLKVVSVDAEKNVILIKGSVPGGVNAYVEIRKRKGETRGKNA